MILVNISIRGKNTITIVLSTEMEHFPPRYINFYFTYRGGKCSISVERTIVYREACPRGELVLETQEWTFPEVCILFYSQSII
jgi:hypothetical protein